MNGYGHVTSTEEVTYQVLLTKAVPGTGCSILRGSETSQLGRQTWQGQARAGAPKRPQPSGAAEGLYKVTCPATFSTQCLCAKAGVCNVMCAGPRAGHIARGRARAMLGQGRAGDKQTPNMPDVP